MEKEKQHYLLLLKLEIFCDALKKIRLSYTDNMSCWTVHASLVFCLINNLVKGLLQFSVITESQLITVL